MELCFWLCVFSAVIASASFGLTTEEVDAEWATWKKEHGKFYRSEVDENNRRKAWDQNVKDILQHNEEYNTGPVTFKMAVNRFSDLTNDELSAMHEFKASMHSRHGRRHVQHHSCQPPRWNQLNVPAAVDWRSKGYVTEVKDELSCISSVYFGITGALEGQWFRKTGNLTSLSEQNIKDCCEKDSSQCSTFLEGTCSFDEAYHYVKSNGVESLADYPDIGQGEKCAYDPNKRAAVLSGYGIITPNEKVLKTAVANIGPISVAVDSSQPSFTKYGGGVYDEPACTTTKLDHAMLVVGYGTDPKAGDYWIVKNSWGAQWGLKGYMLMSRNKDNQCGIATSATYPFFECRS